MSFEMSFGGGDLTGKLLEGAEERIRASSLSGIAGRRIILEAVKITYRLEDQPQPWGLSGNVRILPGSPTVDDAEPCPIAKRFDDWAV